MDANASINAGWFIESSVLWPGQKSSLALEGLRPSSVLFSDRSQFQSILVFKSAQHGKVLCLDGVIQFTERDEFCYAEMISNVPIMSHDGGSHGNPKTILIIGGGDGGVLREVCRHGSVGKIILVEIDAKVIEVTKRFFDAEGVFEDPRLEIVHLDAADFLAEGEHLEEFDIIINDSSDPCGPSERLYSPAFFEEMYKSLKPGGIVCSQCESMWLNLDFACDMMAANAGVFDRVEYANIMVPTYPSGSIGIICGRKASEDGEVGVCSRPSCKLPPEIRSKMKYYSSRTHKSCFVLPARIQRRMDRAVSGEDLGGGDDDDEFDDDNEDEDDDDDDDDDDDGNEGSDEGERGVCAIS
ncbi:hypothetical protein TrST_g5699 [Triparma strigata]|uniref:PABS domain-containing protein n=1 Tax=Triparma strigata TaxID=1606541 RepID=A0A9W7AQW4_9STRA|nr:hypothetical protein TrST_g5699 [Triparma strigata]